MLKLNLQYFAEGVEIEYDGETSNLPVGKQARFACKDKSMPSDIVIKNKGVGEISGVTVTKDKVLEGETFYGSNGLEEGTMPNNGYVDGDYGATLDLNFTELLLNGAYRGSVTIYPQEVTIVPSDISQEISPAEGRVFGKIKVEKIPPADEWNGTGITIAPIAKPTITINGTTYNAYEGQTWFSWANNLDYNTDNFKCLTEDSKVFEAESENYVIDSNENAVTGGDLIVIGGVYRIKEVVTTDELAGTWVFDDIISVPSSKLTFYVDFTSNNINFNVFIVNTNGTIIIYANDPSGTQANVYTVAGGWSSNSWKTINITSKLSEVTNGATLLTWLRANATKQGAANLISFTVDGTTYQAEEGMTWGEWIYSEYNTNSNFSSQGLNVGYNSGSYVYYVVNPADSINRVLTDEDIIANNPYGLWYTTGGSND